MCSLDELREQMAESDRLRRQLQLELDEVMSNKDDQGRSVHDLERAKRELEQRVAEMKQVSRLAHK